MTEKEKMLSGELYLACDPELSELRAKAKNLLFRYNSLNPNERETRDAVLRELLGKAGKNICVESPFYCDYGINISVGNDFFSNYNLTILDCAEVVIGDDVMIAPNVGIYAATHPLDAVTRCDVGRELGYSVKIGNRVWIGGNAVILPGITIGDEAVIAAGAVVTKDVPEKVVVAGNPARIIRKL